ncbi:MAG: hypothetical protein ABSB12_02825 [Candidatus Saccharimonadales bacterium]|jgi:Tfp pilus assembly protein PilE
MKGGKQPHGFTVIEIMIFLAVSGAIFISAITLMSGSQDKTEFNTAITELTSQLQSIVGNVANGYYLSQQNFTCTPNPTGSPSLAYSTTSESGTARGTSLGCTFIGEVIQFNSTNEEYIAYPVVGNQYNPPTNSPGPNNLNVTDLTQAAPVALYDSTDSPDVASVVNSELDTTEVLPYGITVHPSGMGFADSSIVINPSDKCTINNVNLACIGSIGLFTTFNGSSQSVQVVPIPGSILTQDQLSLVSAISNMKNGTGNNIIGGSGSYSTVSDPDGGVEICLDSGTDSESGLITIGGTNSPTAVTLQKYSQKGCT